MLRRVAVTGGLSSGKSTVCHLFKALGAHVVSADEIVHRLLSPKTPLGHQVIFLLGQDVVKGEEFDRHHIADRIFQDEALLNQFEHLIHPLVDAEIKNQYQEVSKDPKSTLFVAEIPLLFESGDYHWFHTTINVEAPLSECLHRFQAASGTNEDFSRRMKRQLPISQKSQLADITILNNQDKDHLKTTVLQLYRALTQGAAPP